MKGAAGGMYRNNVAGPLWAVCVAKESDTPCKITGFLKSVLRCTSEKQPYRGGMYTAAIFTTSGKNVNENYVKEPIETRSSATGNQFQGWGGGREPKRRQEQLPREMEENKVLPFFFFAFVKLGVTPSVGKKCG